jgi:hypothetical protein
LENETVSKGKEFMPILNIYLKGIQRKPTIDGVKRLLMRTYTYKPNTRRETYLKIKHI